MNDRTLDRINEVIDAIASKKFFEKRFARTDVAAVHGNWVHWTYKDLNVAQRYSTDPTDTQVFIGFVKGEPVIDSGYIIRVNALLRRARSNYLARINEYGVLVFTPKQGIDAQEARNGLTIQI